MSLSRSSLASLPLPRAAYLRFFWFHFHSISLCGLLSLCPCVIKPPVPVPGVHHAVPVQGRLTKSRPLTNDNHRRRTSRPSEPSRRLSSCLGLASSATIHQPHIAYPHPLHSTLVTSSPEITNDGDRPACSHCHVARGRLCLFLTALAQLSLVFCSGRSPATAPPCVLPRRSHRPPIPPRKPLTQYHSSFLQREKPEIHRKKKKRKRER